MILLIEVETKQDVIGIINALADAADYHRKQANRWITKFGEKDDEVDVSLNDTSAMFERVCKSLVTQMKEPGE